MIQSIFNCKLFMIAEVIVVYQQDCHNFSWLRIYGSKYKSWIVNIHLLH